jgi:uncharacterized protein
MLRFPAKARYHDIIDWEEVRQMRLDDEQESSNFEIQGPGHGGGGINLGGGAALPLLAMLFGRGKLGCGTIALIGLALIVIGPSNLLGMLGGGGMGGTPQVQQASPVNTDPTQLSPVQRMSLKVLGSTERRWTDIFAQQGLGQYRPTTLIFYDRNGMSGCGAAQAAMGPFYCPADERIYLDTSFFDEMSTRFGAAGDFVAGYIIAHEVGHHIQHITGIADQVRREQQRASEAQGNALQVRMELQADCLAGVWAANDQNLLEAGDVEEGLRAAAAIGDDMLQRNAGQRVQPESFTHGTSEQRATWLKRGLQSGDMKSCDTFAQ